MEKSRRKTGKSAAQIAQFQAFQKKGAMARKGRGKMSTGKKVAIGVGSAAALAGGILGRKKLGAGAKLLGKAGKSSISAIRSMGGKAIGGIKGGAKKVKGAIMGTKGFTTSPGQKITQTSTPGLVGKIKDKSKQAYNYSKGKASAVIAKTKEGAKKSYAFAKKNKKSIGAAAGAGAIGAGAGYYAGKKSKK